MPRLRHTHLALGLLCTAIPSAHAADKPRHAPDPKPAAQYMATDTHPDEHVTIAAEPCTDPKVCPYFRLPYIQHGFIPVRVVIANDSDKPLSLDDVRIQFISANKDVIPAATPEDINRRLFTKRSAEGTKLGPLPLTIHHAPIDKQVSEDDTDFGFPGTVVAPHASLSGFLFYDVRQLDDPPLHDAELYLKQIHTLDNKQQLFAFTIPFNKWLDAQPKPPAEKKPAPPPDPTPSDSTPPDKPTDSAPAH